MKKKQNILILFFSIFVILFVADRIIDNLPKNLVEYVNPLVGTESSFKFSNGNTYPAIAVPWGMNFWTPQTAKNGDGWAYAYQSNTIRGFKMTHQPSPWINDYGCFSIMPGTPETSVNQKERQLEFSHDNETASPHFYQVEFKKARIKSEITPTDRCGFFRFTYPEDKNSCIIIDAYAGGSYLKYHPQSNQIIGYSSNNHGGVPDNFKNYYVLNFLNDIEKVEIYEGDSLTDMQELEANHVQAKVWLKKAENRVQIQAGASFISFEQAKLNLQREIGNDGFDNIRKKAKKEWNKNLNIIQTHGGTEKQNITFYSALYRVLLFPRKFYEFDEHEKIIHYSPYNGKVEDGYMFTDNGFWDTFRGVFPFFTIFFPEMDAQIMQGLVNTYKEGGWLPEWASPGYRNCMIGAHAASLIADAVVKGIHDFDIETAFEAMEKDATEIAPMPALGRLGVEYYNRLGYVPCDVGINESAARSLEYAYDDFCMMQVAKHLGKDDSVIGLYENRAYNYKHLFDPGYGWMRGKNEDGSWQAPYNPFAWGGSFTEGNAIHYTWSVFQDPQGLIQLMGGKEIFVSKLDSVFDMPPTFDDSYYGYQIHEITEMIAANMGQYAHGNQPIQHMIYLYNYAGQAWKAQKWSRYVMDNLYGPGPDGYCGDEDNGQTSAWYVMSALGFYSVCPGHPSYALGSPLFPKTTLNLPNNKKLTIVAKDNSKDNIYIQEIEIKGKEYTKNYLNHSVFRKNGRIVMKMGKTPNKERGIKPEDRPYSLSLKND